MKHNKLIIVMEKVVLTPDIVKLLIEASKNEQAHRHYPDTQKIKIINKDNRAMHFINMIGLTFAFLIIFGSLALSACQIFLNKDITRYNICRSNYYYSSNHFS
jgi:uncharacterized membrane protein